MSEISSSIRASVESNATHWFPWFDLAVEALSARSPFVASRSFLLSARLSGNPAAWSNADDLLHMQRLCCWGLNYQGQVGNGATANRCGRVLPNFCRFCIFFRRQVQCLSLCAWWRLPLNAPLSRLKFFYLIVLAWLLTLLTCVQQLAFSSSIRSCSSVHCQKVKPRCISDIYRH
jgi:hypothetical protein